MSKRKPILKTKLTAKERSQIKKSPYGVVISKYGGPAKGFITKSRKAAEIRKAEKHGYVQVGQTVIKESSDAYKIIKTVAEQHKTPVEKFVKKKDVAEKLEGLFKDQKLKVSRESSRLMDDIHFGVGDIILNGKKVSKKTAQLAIAKFDKEVKKRTKAFVVIPDSSVSMKGDIMIDLPELPKRPRKGKSEKQKEKFSEWQQTWQDLKGSGQFQIIKSPDDEDETEEEIEE